MPAPPQYSHPLPSDGSSAWEKKKGKKSQEGGGEGALRCPPESSSVLSPRKARKRKGKNALKKKKRGGEGSALDHFLSLNLNFQAGEEREQERGPFFPSISKREREKKGGRGRSGHFSSLIIERKKTAGKKKRGGKRT